MNRFVQSWNRHHSKPIEETPDTVSLDEEEQARVIPSRETMERKSMATSPRKVFINRDDFVEMALYGDQSKVDSMVRALRKAADRIGLNLEGGEPLKADYKSCTTPSMLDVNTWLDAVGNGRQFWPDHRFMQRLYATALPMASTAVRG